MTAFRKSENDIKHNAKIKFYDDEHCTLTAFNRRTFLESGWECANKKRRRSDCDTGAMSAAADVKPERQRDDSILRAKKAVYDIAYANGDDWRYMVTLTLDGSKIDRYDPKAIIKPFQNWLKNCVKRKGLKALLVPEHHADGAIHFHGLVNGALTVSDSGTVKVTGHKKPIKVETAKRLRVNAEDMKPVYNCDDWRLGFSTFVPIDENINGVCTYVTKYITKEFSKIFSRSYFAVGDIKRNVDSKLLDIDFDELISGGGENGAKVVELPNNIGKVAYLSGTQTDILTLVESISQTGA